MCWRFHLSGADFSGLPILTPIDVENLFRILIPEDFEIICGTEESLIFVVLETTN